MSDTDGDALSDGYKLYVVGSSPLDVDTDDDGLSDGAELNTHSTSPLGADSDGDGLSDGAEVNSPVPTRWPQTPTMMPCLMATR